MKKSIISIALMVVAALLVGAAAVAVFFIYTYMPSKEIREDTEWFGVSGDEVAIIYQDQPQEQTGLYVDGQVYLPLQWAADYLNERFYWDEGGQQLIYTLPDQIVYAGLSTVGSNGAKLIHKQGGEVYLITGIISAYTDARMEVYADTGAKRIFIDDRWQDIRTAVLAKGAAIREAVGSKSAVLTSRPKGDCLTVLGVEEDWSQVKTADGFLGFIESDKLGDYAAVPQISAFTAPEYTNISLEEEICLVWHQVFSQSDNGNLEQLLERTKGVNVVAPTWFMLTDNQGSYVSWASKEYVDIAHQQGLQVWAAIDNFNKGANVNSEILFASTKARADLIADLIADVKEYGIDGINLDIEGIRPEAGPHYVQFIRELSVGCRKEQIVLSVDNYVPSAYTSFYNRAEQGRVADYVIVMAYDEHNAKGGVAGSVSSISHVKNGIENTLKEVPKEKLICALPFYTRRWEEVDGKVSATEMGLARAAAWMEENQVEAYWQEELAQSYGELKDGETFYQIWLEDDHSLARKIEVVRGYGLAGAAYWKLGLETPDIWNVVKP